MSVVVIAHRFQIEDHEPALIIHIRLATRDGGI